MSEPIPESIPTSHDRHTRRPVKRQAVTPSAKQASQVEALFANPERDIALPRAGSGNRSHGGGVGPPPEIVNNVQGSSAGAGSGEFHVYKASRRREYERLKAMDEEVQQEKDAEDFERTREEKKEREEKRMGKNKSRRDKAKMRKKGGAVAVVEGKSEPRANGEERREVEGSREEKGVERREADEAREQEEEVGLVIHDDD